MDKTARILFICLSVALAAGVGYFWNARNAEPKSHLVILHANDTHSHFEPVRDEEYPGMGGIIERAAYLDSVRVAEGPENVLLLHAGDFSQGTTYFSELGGNLEVQALNAMKYDVVTLGNHEFDNGLEDLGRRLSSLEMPVVVCNYDFSPFEAGKYIKPYVIVEKAGLKIGVIGVLCDLKSMVAGDIAERVPEFPMVETVGLRPRDRLDAHRLRGAHPRRHHGPDPVLQDPEPGPDRRRPFAHFPGRNGVSAQCGRRSDAHRPGRLLRHLLGTD